MRGGFGRRQPPNPGGLGGGSPQGGRISIYLYWFALFAQHEVRRTWPGRCRVWSGSARGLSGLFRGLPPPTPGATGPAPGGCRAEPGVVRFWVPEGSRAEIFGRHGMALELVCRADFWCNRHCKTSPVVLEGFRGQVWPKISRKPAPSKQIDFGIPLSILAVHWHSRILGF